MDLSKPQCSLKEWQSEIGIISKPLQYIQRDCINIVGADATRLGIVQFATYVQLELSLDYATNIYEAMEVIENMMPIGTPGEPAIGQQTNTLQALKVHNHTPFVGTNWKKVHDHGHRWF